VSIRRATDQPARIMHHELIATVLAANPAVNGTYVVNARNPVSFPWLSVLAANYDMYHFVKLSYAYEPSCSTTTTGNLVMAFDYDVLDDNSATTSSLLSAYAGAVTGQLYANMTCSFSPSNTVISAHKYFCKSATTTKDRLADMATFIYRAETTATVGTVLGRIYADYVVDLFNPELNQANLSASSMVANLGTATTSTATASNKSPLGSTMGALEMLEQVIGNDQTVPIKQFARYLGNNPQLIGQFMNYVNTGSFSLLGYPDLLTGWQRWSPGIPDVYTDIAVGDTSAFTLITDTQKFGGDYLVLYKFAGGYTAIDAVNAPSPLVDWDVNNASLVYRAYQRYPDNPGQEPIHEGNSFVCYGFFYIHVTDITKPVGIGLSVSSTYGTWDTITPATTNHGRDSFIHVIPAAHLSQY